LRRPPNGLAERREPARVVLPQSSPIAVPPRRVAVAGPATGGRPCAGSGRQVGADLLGGAGAVRLGQSLDEVGGLDLVLLGADGLQHLGGQHRADLGGAFEGQVPGQGGEEAGAEAVADAGRVVRLDLVGDRYVDRVEPAAGDPYAVAAQRGDPYADQVEDL